MAVENPDVDYDENGSPKPKLGANRRYEKFKGLLDKNLELSVEKEELEAVEVFKDRDEINEIKYLMRKRVGSPFVTNVLRVALNFCEEKIASKIISEYKAKLDEQMIIVVRIVHVLWVVD